ncbi:MAG: potassium transporter Kef [Gammaproteobacteria bacterium]|nr:MAG: potassium transporter Kef [Gammaproteobacteria bacterium]
MPLDSMIALVALGFGFAARQVRLPPMVGYLLAGFVLGAWGLELDGFIRFLADAGILLMLFIIGLKLDIRSLFRPEIYRATLEHTLSFSLLAGLFFMGLGALGLPVLTDLSWREAAMVAFALSFSSTVCVVAMLEEAGEFRTRHGQLAIGILIMQDIVAVLFLVVSTGKLPTLWALLLPGLYWARPLLSQLLARAGHDEVLALTGIMLAAGGSYLFEAVGMKPDLGALAMGMLLAGDRKASELSKSIMNLKDILLISFFVSIGLAVRPDINMIITGLLLCLLLPLKSLLWLGLLVRYPLRVRTAWLASAHLLQFSEFGLIVAAVAQKNGWLPEAWMGALAIAVSVSFVISTVFNARAHRLYGQLKARLHRLERGLAHTVDPEGLTQGADVLIVGMGRVGAGAYDAIACQYRLKVVGVESDESKVPRMRGAGRKVIYGDAEDADFWEELANRPFRLIMLAIPSASEIIQALHLIREAGFTGKVAAIAKWEEDRVRLVEAGADVAFNVYAEAGIGFAEHTLSRLVDVLPEHRADDEKLGTVSAPVPVSME